MTIKLTWIAAALVAVIAATVPTRLSASPASDDGAGTGPTTQRVGDWPSTATPIGSRHSRQVKARGGETYRINQYAQEHLRFVPGTITVDSGSTLTFSFGDKEDEDHTLTILPKAELPRTAAQINQCEPCKIARGHLKNPNDLADALTAKTPFVHWTLDKGRPGLDTAGDSLAIESGGAHRTNSAIVSAAPGTVLYFVCVVHPWMQGKIIVR